MSPLLFPAIMRLPSRLQAVGSGLPGWLENLLLVLLCWQLVGLFWVLLAPSTAHVNLSMPQQSLDKNMVVRDTFLSWYANESKTSAEPAETFRLLGVIAGPNGAAVVRTTDGNSIAVRLGDTIVAGTTLVVLEPNQIIIERSGVQQTIKLPQKASSPSAANGEQAYQPIPMLAPGQEQQLAKPGFPISRMSRGQAPVSPVTGSSNGLEKSSAPVSDGNARGDSFAAPSAQAIQSLPNTSTSQTATVDSRPSTPTLPPIIGTPTQETLAPIKLSRGQLLGIIQGGNVGGWDKGLSSAPDGGIRVDNADAQPLARILQLKSGDILKSINNRPINQLSDISLLINSFGLQSSVDLVLIRNGATLTQHYDIQP